MNDIRSAMRAAKNAVMQFSDVEIKVREATSNDPWGPTSTLMAEIARATNDYQEYPKLFHRLWQRLNDVEHVMHVQKALILVDYLLRNGAERFINDAKRRARDIAQLKRFKHYDSNNNDDAKEARNKAKLVYDLLMNDKQLSEERQKARKIMDVKSQGFGTDVGGSNFGSDYGRDEHYGGSAYDNNNSYDNGRSNNNTNNNNGSFDNHDVDDWTKDTRNNDDRKNEANDNDADGEKVEKKKKKKKKPVKEEEPQAQAPEPEAPAPVSEPEQEPVVEKKKKKEKDGVEKKKKKKKDKEEEGPGQGTGFGSDPFASNGDPFGASNKSNSASAQYNDFLNSNNNNGNFSSSNASSGEDFLAKLQAQGGIGNYDRPNNNHFGSGNDVDILTGQTSGLSIADMFAQQQNNDPSSPAFTSQEPLVFDEIQAERSQQEAAQNSDLWHAASDLTNLDNIRQQERVQRKKKQEDGMSMAMMRSIQPLGTEKHTVVLPPPVAAPQPMMVPANIPGGSTALVLVPQPGYGVPGYGQPGFGYQPGYGMPALGAAPYGNMPPLGGQYGSPFPAPAPVAPIRTAPHYGGQGGAAPAAQKAAASNPNTIPVFDVPRANPSPSSQPTNSAALGIPSGRR